MSRVTRKRARVSYYEPEEPGFDEYIFCTDCGDYVYEYCCIHGPLLVVPDDEVPNPTGYPSFVPRAALTIPRMFLHLAPSTIPDGGIGVFSTLTLPRGVRFGPYCGLKTDDSESAYCWQIFDRDHKPSHLLDARDANRSNWMRYVNCSRHYSEQNLVAFQYQGQLYYRTIKIVPRFTELLVFYGSEFASELNIDLRGYHLPVYMETIVKSAEEKSHITVEPLKQHTETSANIKNLQDLKPQSDNQYQEFSDSSNLYIDESTKENDDPIENDKQYACSETVKEKSVFTAHLPVQNEVNKAINKNTCSICNVPFATKSDLINHEINIHNSNIKFKACPICDFKTTGKLNKHINWHNNKVYKCNICMFETKTEVELSLHVKGHKELGDKVCKTCGKEFKKLYALRRHMKIHSYQEKNHECTVCMKRFSEEYNLKKHMKRHSQEKSYVCDFCQHVSSDAYQLKRHTNSRHANKNEFREMGNVQSSETS